MEMIIKISAAAVLCTVCVILVRQYRPELSLFVQTAGLAAVIIAGAAVLTGVKAYCENIFSQDFIEQGYLVLLVKALSVTVVSKIAGDICRDSGNSALAFGVELVAKGSVLLMILPMLKNLAEVTSGLLKG